MIVDQAFVDPDNLLCIERLTQRRFGCFLAPSIAVGIQEGLTRCQERSLAVVIDSAALKDKLEPANLRSGNARHVVTDRRIVGQVVLAPPTIDPKAQGDSPVGTARKDWARIAQPDIPVFCRNEISTSAQHVSGRSLGLGPIHEHANAVRLAQRVHHRRHIAARRLKIAIPLLWVGRPGRPNGLLRGPLGGDANFFGY